MDRRTFLLLAPSAALMAGTARAQTGFVTLEEIRASFQRHPADVRRMLQQSLAGEGYYLGAIDGSWGPGTANAYKTLITSARYRRHAARWTWSREVQVGETLFFLTSDAYL